MHYSCSPANSPGMHSSHCYIDATQGGVRDVVVHTRDRRPGVATQCDARRGVAKRQERVGWATQPGE